MISSNFSAFSDIAAPQGEAVVSAPQGPFFSVDPIDVGERLPDEAKGHLSALRDHVEALYETVERLGAKRQEAWQKRGEAELNYKKLTDPTEASRYSRTHIKEDHPEATAAKAKFDKAASAARAAQDRYDAAAERWRTQKRLLSDTESYVATAGNLTMAPAPKLKFPTVDRLAAEVEKIRKDIAELQAEKHAVRSAAYPSAEVKARACQELDALAEAGRPNVLRMIDNGPAEGIVWPNLVARSHIFGMSAPLPHDVRHVGHDLPGSHLALMAFLFKTELLMAIEAEIDAAAEDENAISTDDRAAKLLELDARILDVERVECAIIRNAGPSLDFRETADPRAMLGVDGPAPQEAD